MKLQYIKLNVYEALEIKNTQELKKLRPDLVENLDLRKKESWECIQKIISAEIDSLLAQTIKDAREEVDKSNQIIKQSLNNWEKFKRKVSNDSNLENQGKLHHLSDYKTSKKKKRKTKITKSNILHL